MKKLLILVMSVFLSLLLITSCGNNNVETSSKETTDSTPGGTTESGGDDTMTQDVTTSSSPEDTGGQTAGVSEEELYPQFSEPDKNLTTKPLWFWNTDLDSMTTDQVREIVRESYLQSGYTGFGILPYWMDDYMSEKYFELYEAALDEGSKYGMQFSLYDENGFPSYTAGGLFAEKYPELTAKRLDLAEASIVSDGKIFLRIPQGTFMGAVAFNTETKEMIDISDKAVLVELPDFDTETQPLGALASSTFSNEPGYDLAKAFDGNQSTRWNAEGYTGSGSYIQINYGEKIKIDSIKITEPTLQSLWRVSAFEFNWYDEENDEWVTAAEGGKITGSGVTLEFDEIEAQFVRIVFTKVVGDSATISEIALYDNGEMIPAPQMAVIKDESESEFTYSSSSDYSASYTADLAFDGSSSSRWNAGQGTAGNQWLAVVYNEAKTVDTVFIYESFDRVRSFKIQYMDEKGNWIDCASGTTIGTQGKELSFEPVTAYGMRLYVNTTNGDTVSINEFEVYGDGKVIAAAQDNSNYKGSYVEYPVSGSGWRLMAFVCVYEGCTGMDYLSEEAVAGFIEITYEGYYKRFKEYFDNGTITSAFYDEPSFWPAGGLTAYGVEGARMWTDDFNEYFAQMYGDDINPVLLYAALWYDIGENTNEARDMLQSVRTEMFAKNYLGQITDWCEEHGIQLMGHMLMEDVENPVAISGDLMYCFKYQSIPAVDVIDRFGMTELYYKVISSAAYNWDKELVASETYGAMGANLPVSHLYKTAMDLYAKGINLIVPHAVWYDNVNNVVYPPELSYRNPRYAEELPTYNEYVSRLSVMLQGGRHVADVAVLYPIDYLESVYIFNGGYNVPSDSNYITLTDILSTELRIDFTYLHPSVLDEKCTVNGNILHLENEVNYENYKLIVIPSMKVISLSNLEKIYEFYQNGGVVISVGTLPDQATRAEDDESVRKIISDMFGNTSTAQSVNTNDKGGAAYHATNTAAFKSLVNKAFDSYDVNIGAVNVSGGNLTYIHKVNHGVNIYFFANSSDTKVSTEVTIAGEFENLEFWDPMTGEAVKATTTVADGLTTVTLELDAVESVFLVEVSG